MSIHTNPTLNCRSRGASDPLLRSFFQPVIKRLGTALVAATILAAAPLQAANIWDGGGADDNWGTALNWDDDAVPAFPVALTFAGGTRLTPTNEATGRTVSGITFGGGASAFTLVGQPVTLTGGVTNSSTSLQTISLPIITTAVRTFATAPGGANFAVNGGISGTGGGLSINGGGTLTLGGNNAFTGSTTVTNALLVLAANNALATNNGLILQGPNSYLDLAGFDQKITFLDGTDLGSGNTTASGTYITNSAANQVTLTITNYGNNFRFRQGNLGGNVKLLLTANNLNNTQSGRPGSAFQFQAPGNTYSGGTVISGPFSNPLTVSNLNSSFGFLTTGNTNTAIMRYYNAGLGFSVFGSGPITLDNGELWGTSIYYQTNPITITSRGGILNCEANQFFTEAAPITGTGLLALESNGGKIFTFSNSLSGFTGTLALDANTTSMDLCSNSPAGDLVFWGAFSAGRGVVRWNGDPSAPVTLSFTRVNCGAAGGIAGGVTTVGTLSCANAATLTYRLGDNTATTNLFGGTVINGSGTVGVTKIGSNTQTLAGANTYTGPTYVGGGTLHLTGVNDGSGGCVISNTATLNFGGTGSFTGAGTVEVKAGGTLASGGASINGLVALNSGNAAINLLDSVINTNTLAGGLTLGSGNVLTFDIGSATDVIAVTGGTYTKNPGTVTVNVSGVGFTAGTHPLITGASIVSTSGFTLGTVPSSPSYTYALVADSGNLALQVTLAVVSPSAAFWKGGVNNNWSTADSGPNFNWATTTGGTTTTGSKPGAPTAVTFSAFGAANQATILGGNFEIASLALTTSGSVGIGGANTLQINSGGITISSGAGSLTISNTSVVLGGAQAWTNASSSPITVTAPISGLSALTIGGGTTALSGANSHAGTVVNAGTVNLSGAGTLGNASATVTANSGTINLGGSSQTVGVVTVTNGGNIASGTISGSGYDLQSGTISAAIAGSAAAVKNSSDTVILSANNTFSGSLAVSNGVLQVGAGGATGTLNPSTLYIDALATFSVNTSVSQTNTALVSGSGPLQVRGGGSLRLANLLTTYTGEILVDGSTLAGFGAGNVNNAGVGPLGSATVARSITLSNAATLWLASGNILGSGNSTICNITTVANDGSQIVLNANNDANILGPVVLNNSQLSVANGFSSRYQGAILLGSVTVGGTNTSTILTTGADGTRNGVMLGAGGTDAISDLGKLVTFDVSVTGTTNADLIVSARLVDPANSPSLDGTATVGAGGINKQGAGTMLLATNNTYTGPTVVTAGKLIVSSVQGATGMTNYVAVNDSAALGIKVAGISQWLPVTATLGTGSGATLEFSGINSTTIAPLNPGVFSVAGTLTINITSPIYGVGTYPLVNNWDNSGVVTLGTLPSGNTATLDTSTSTIKLVVTAAPTNPAPAPITSSVSGNTLNLSWPSDRLGWTLQSNSVSVAQPAQWFPVAGSTTVTNMAFTINPNKTNVFFRLTYP